MIAGSVEEFGNAWIVNGGSCDPSQLIPPCDPCNIESQVGVSCNFQSYMLDYNLQNISSNNT